MVVTSDFAVIARFCVFNVTCNEVGGNTTPDLVGGIILREWQHFIRRTNLSV